MKCNKNRTKPKAHIQPPELEPDKRLPAAAAPAAAGSLLDCTRLEYRGYLAPSRDTDPDEAEPSRSSIVLLDPFILLPSSRLRSSSSSRLELTMPARRAGESLAGEKDGPPRRTGCAWW